MTYKIIITGKVQGVAFRYSAKSVADNLGITGYAKNLYDGSVEIMASGKEQELNQLLSWCHQGPSRARVEHVEMEIIAEKAFVGFIIR